jgi:hypothetical protein
VVRFVHFLSIAALLSLITLVAGCKSTPRPATDRLASVLIAQHGPDEIHLVTMAVFREAGWKATTPAGDEMIFERKASTMDTVFFGDWIGGEVWLRAKVDLRVKDVRHMLLGCDVYRVIDHNDKFFEEQKKVKTGGHKEAQKLLDLIAQRLATAPPIP